MSEQFEVTKQNKVRQLREKAEYDRETVFRILDAGLCAHAAFVQDGQPVVVPMLYGRDGETLYLHGARKARVVRLLESTDSACVNVTLLDGVVYARSTFNSSMNYRSVTVFGTPRLIDGHEEKLRALRIISECTMPGRWGEVRDSLENEVKMTGVIAVDIDSASAKISDKMPSDEEFDKDADVWAGILPIETRFGTPRADDLVKPGTEPTAALKKLAGKSL